MVALVGTRIRARGLGRLRAGRYRDAAGRAARAGIPTRAPEDTRALGLGALAAPGLRRSCSRRLPVGFALGTLEVVLPAFSEAEGSKALAGVLLAVWSAPAARRPRLRSTPRARGAHARASALRPAAAARLRGAARRHLPGHDGCARGPRRHPDRPADRVAKPTGGTRGSARHSHRGVHLAAHRAGRRRRARRCERGHARRGLLMEGGRDRGRQMSAARRPGAAGAPGHAEHAAVAA